MRSATREFQLDEIEPIDQSKIARAILSRVVNVEFLWAARARNPAMRAIELKRMRSEKNTDLRIYLANSHIPKKN